MRLILYARKFSQGEDRPAQSLNDQTRLLRAHALRHNLLVVEEIAEAKPANDPHCRPLFEQMLQRIEDGEADGILCWHLNCLSRNLVDGARVGYLFQQGRLRIIETPERAFHPEDNVPLFSVESGMANQFIRELSKGVRRGMASKVEKGWAPQVAPPGYLNDVYHRTIVADPERFVLVRQAWELMLTGTVSVPQMLLSLNGEWAFRTRQERHRGGTPLTLSSAHRMLRNVFYTGKFLREGVLYDGQHPAMVTMEEWDRVQTILSREGIGRYRRHEFAYTGLIRCGRCGCGVTAEFAKGRVYYHCTNKRGICDRKGVTEADLERQFVEALEGVHLREEVEDVLLGIIREWQVEPSRQSAERYEQLHRRLEGARSEQRELLGLRLRKVIDDTLLQSEQERLTQEIMGLEKEASRLGTTLSRQVESAVRSIEFAAHARAKFVAGDPHVRRLIVRMLGAEMTLTGKQLRIERHPLLEFIGEHQQAFNGLALGGKLTGKTGLISGGYEPVIIGSESTKKGDILSSVSFGGADDTLHELCRRLLEVAQPLSMLFPALPKP